MKKQKVIVQLLFLSVFLLFQVQVKGDPFAESVPNIIQSMLKNRGKEYADVKAEVISDKNKINLVIQELDSSWQQQLLKNILIEIKQNEESVQALKDWVPEYPSPKKGYVAEIEVVGKVLAEKLRFLPMIMAEALWKNIEYPNWRAKGWKKQYSQAYYIYAMHALNNQNHFQLMNHYFLNSKRSDSLEPWLYSLMEDYLLNNIDKSNLALILPNITEFNKHLIIQKVMPLIDGTCMAQLEEMIKESHDKSKPLLAEMLKIAKMRKEKNIDFDGVNLGLTINGTDLKSLVELIELITKVHISVEPTIKKLQIHNITIPRQPLHKTLTELARQLNCKLHKQGEQENLRFYFMQKPDHSKLVKLLKQFNPDMPAGEALLLLNEILFHAEGEDADLLKQVEALISKMYNTYSEDSFKYKLVIMYLDYFPNGKLVEEYLAAGLKLCQSEMKQNINNEEKVFYIKNLLKELAILLGSASDQTKMRIGEWLQLLLHKTELDGNRISLMKFLLDNYKQEYKSYLKGLLKDNDTIPAPERTNFIKTYFPDE